MKVIHVEGDNVTCEVGVGTKWWWKELRRAGRKVAKS